ncbi:MAG TPA: ABC transporter permease [Fimbriimonadaceae bacterium]|jgi:ABC-type polysaccharide/polyol phosphate export permease
MLAELKALWQYRELLISMVSRDLKIRYKNSFFGFLWSFINPLTTVIVISYIFKSVIGQPIQNFSAYVLAAYLPYMFFSMAIMDATGSVLANLGIVKKIYFPRETLPLTSIIANFIHFLLAQVVFFTYLTVLFILNPKDVPFQATTIYLPLLLVISFLLATGIGLLCSAVNTFFEDVKYIMGFVLQMMLFLSPIMWVAEKMAYVTPRRYLLMELLNPVGVLCNAFRKVLLAPTPVNVNFGDTPVASNIPGHGPLNTILANHDVAMPALPIEWGMLAYTGALSLIVFFGGYWVFNRYKWRFVERP